MDNDANQECIKVSWSEYFQLIVTLIKQVKAAGFVPNQIICIARGGLIPGDIISRTLNLPLAILSVSSYIKTEDNHHHNNKVKFSYDLTSVQQLNSQVLLVDDLTDSGSTLLQTLKWLNFYYESNLKEIKTAVLWHKETSVYQPDFYARFIPLSSMGKCPWIIQPQDQLADNILNNK